MTEERMLVDEGGGRQRSVPVDYPSNSKSRKKDEGPPKEKVVKPVVTGNVVTRKKGIFGRAGDSLLAENREGVLQYIVMEVLVPAAKTMISDALSQGVDRLLFGEMRTRSSADRPGGYISYNTVRRTKPEYRAITPGARRTHDFDVVIIPNRGEAEDVLDALRELISVYDQATVGDFYDLVGITSNFTDDKWGWYDLRPAMIRHVRGGYVISLPRPQPLE